MVVAISLVIKAQGSRRQKTRRKVEVKPQWIGARGVRLQTSTSSATTSRELICRSQEHKYPIVLLQCDGREALKILNVILQAGSKE